MSDWVSVGLESVPRLRRGDSSPRARRLLAAVLRRRHLQLSEALLQLPYAQLSAALQQHGLWVSISHCRGMLAVALGSCPVALDVEPVDQQRNWLALAENFFHADEAQFLAQLPAAQRGEEFLQSWVLKEACVKLQAGSIFGQLNDLIRVPGGLRLRAGLVAQSQLLGAQAHRGEQHIYGLLYLADSPPSLETCCFEAGQCQLEEGFWSALPLTKAGVLAQ